MEKAFNLAIVTPEKVFYQGEVVSLVAPCENGYLGVLADHAPLVALTKNGKITIIDTAKQNKEFVCHNSGFLEVFKNSVTMIIAGGGLDG